MLLLYILEITGSSAVPWSLSLMSKISCTLNSCGLRLAESGLSLREVKGGGLERKGFASFY